MRIVDMQTGREASLKVWDGSRWAPARNLGGGPAVEVSVHPPAGPLRNIGAGCAIMNHPVEPAGVPGMLVAARIPVVVDVENPVMDFDVIFASGPVQNTPVAEIQVAVAVGDGEPVPVTFGGAQTARLVNPRTNEAVTVKSDPVPLRARAGDVLNVYGFTGAPEGGRPVGDQAGFNPGTDAWYSGGATFAAAWNGVHITGGQLGAKMLTHGARPARILAPSNKDAWLLAGDSIIHFYRCHAQRWAISAGVAWAKNATGGGTHGTANVTFESAYAPACRAATMVLDELGINGPGYADAIKYWRRMRELGIEGIVKTTLTPRAATRDNWASVEGQTALADVEAYNRWDAWLLDGAPMKRDLSAVAETGATGSDIVRCAVVDSTGKLTRKGDPAHVFGRGGVVDWNPVVSAAGLTPAGSRRVYRTDLGLAAADYGDGLHFGDGIHEALGNYLKKAMPVVLDKSARMEV